MNQINVSSFPKIGNLTKGSGLSCVFDDTEATTGYVEAPIGWAGVDFSSNPQAIGKVEVVSATNGFDASGHTTQILLELRAKNGSPPINPGDGVFIGADAEWFTDQNLQRTITLNCIDNITKWDFVWVMIKTGVWAVAAEIRLFGPEAQIPPTPVPVIGADGATLTRACNSRVKLNYGVVEVAPSRIAFELTEKRVVNTDLHMGFRHTGKSHNGAQDFFGVVGLGMYIIRRSATTQLGLLSAPWNSDPNAVGAGNIFDYTAHYQHFPALRSEELDAGFHEYSIWAGCHTSLLSLDTVSHLGVVDVLAEGSVPPYVGRNLLRVKIEQLGAKLYRL